LIDLKVRECRYATSERINAVVCGMPCATGEQYCKEHIKIVWPSRGHGETQKAHQKPG
jgi:hypothetical protein